MDNLDLRYNDVSYFQITDTIQKSFVTSIKNSIERALKPVKRDIERCQGLVRVNYKDHQLEITTFHLPINLEQKIYRILK